jgi:hypothetical protein
MIQLRRASRAKTDTKVQWTRFAEWGIVLLCIPIS